MSFNTYSNLDNAKPGDIIFYVPSDKNDKLIKFGQTLCPSISSAAAKATHAAIVLPNLMVANLVEDLDSLEAHSIVFAHSYATVRGPHISLRKKDELLGKYEKLLVVSPINPGTDPETELRLRETISLVALQFATEDAKCPSRPCSQIRLGVRPLVNPKRYSAKTFKRKISKGLADFILGKPRIEKFDKAGNPISKASFCTEFVHNVLQVSLFYDRLSGDQIKTLTRFKQKDKPLKTQRDLLVSYIYEHFDELFPEREDDDNHWVRQNSVSFAPGRFLTVLEKNGHSGFTARLQVPEETPVDDTKSPK